MSAKPRSVRLDLGVGDVHIDRGVAVTRINPMAALVTPTKAKKKAKTEAKRRKQIHIRADIATGGALHVRHMNDHEIKGGSLVEFPGLVEIVQLRSGDGSDEKVWIQVAKRGSFNKNGPFELNDRIFQEIVCNFRDTKNRRIPIDYEHASESDPTEGSIPVMGAPAQGWIVDLKIEGGNLYGLVEWGPQAKEQIRTGQYRFFSPAIRFNSRDRETGNPVGARMTSGALTNNPFLDGMMPLVARDFESSPLTPEEEQRSDQVVQASVTKSEMRAAMRVLTAAVMEKCDDDEEMSDEEELDDEEDTDPEMMTVSDITAEADDGDSTDFDAAMSAREETTMADEKAMQLKDTEIAELKITLSANEKKLAELIEENKALLSFKAEAQTRELNGEVEKAFNTYKNARKLTDADKKAMLITLTHAPTVFREQYPEVKEGERHLLTDVASVRANDERGQSQESIVELADRIQAENPKLSRIDAMCKAEIQLRG